MPELMPSRAERDELRPMPWRAERDGPPPMPSRWRAAAAVAVCLPAAFGRGGSAQEPIRSVERAAELYRDVPAMCADFEQTIEVRLLGRRVIESAGRVCRQRPNLFSMRFSDPQGDMVVSDGEYFWAYYPSIDEKQVTRYRVSDPPGGQDFFRELLEEPGLQYDVEEGGIEAVDGRSCRVVTLTPRSGAAYKGARLWLDTDSHVVRRLEIHHQNDNVRTVTLRGLDLSPSIDPGTFVFEVPEGARVRGGSRSGTPPALPPTVPPAISPMAPSAVR